MYIAIRTDDGKSTGKISFYCNTLQVSRQAFYDYLGRKGKPWKYQPLTDAMLKIHDEDEENEVGKLKATALQTCQKSVYFILTEAVNLKIKSLMSLLKPLIYSVL